MTDRELLELAREAEFHVTGQRVLSPVTGDSDIAWLLERFARLHRQQVLDEAAAMLRRQEELLHRAAAMLATMPVKHPQQSEERDALMESIKEHLK